MESRSPQIPAAAQKVAAAAVWAVSLDGQGARGEKIEARFLGSFHEMQRSDARRTAGKTWTFAHQRRRVVEKLAVQLVHPRRETHAARIDLVDGHGRQPCRDRPDFGDRT